MDIKGYNLSTNYSQLWELINNGYRIPAFIETKDDDDVKSIKMVEVVFKFNYYYIKGGGNIYNDVQSKEGFLKVCNDYKLHFIEVNK